MALKYSKNVINPIGRLINGKFIKIYRPKLNFKQRISAFLGRDFVWLRLSTGEYKVYEVYKNTKGFYVNHLNTKHYIIDEGRMSPCTHALSDAIAWEPIKMRKK